MAKIEIKSWRKFRNRNKDIANELEYAASDISAIDGNVTEINSRITDINNNSFSNLRKVKSNANLLIDERSYQSIERQFNTLIEGFQEQAGKVLGALAIAEEEIGGYISNEEANSLFDILYKGYDKTAKVANITGVFWIASYILKDRNNPALAWVANFFGNRADAHQGGTYGSSKLIENFLLKRFDIGSIPGAEEAYKNFLSKGVGAELALVQTIVMTQMHDKGEWNNYDESRAVINGVKNAANYIAWDALAGYIGESIGGTFGGPIGYGVASTAIAGLEVVEEKVVSEITGDVVVDQYKRKNSITGKEDTYVIHKNGGGKDGTYDIYKEAVQESLPKRYKIDGKEYTETNYKKEIYKDWTKTGVINNEDKEVKEYYKKGMDEVLKKVKNAQNLTEAKKIVQKEIYLADTKGHEELNKITRDLEINGFDFSEYYIYQNRERIETGTVEGFHKLD